VRNFTEYPPLTLYIHFPWCIKKCPYCDFNSHTLQDDLPEHEYIDALVTDLELHAPDIWGRGIESIFIGGGTPSLISAESIDRLLSQVRALTKLDPMAEITLEANPGTVETQRFKDYRAAGINRLSIGIQSFNDDHLQILGRIHNAAEGIKACETAQHAGFDNFNIDLMHGLPEQDIKSALRDIKQGLALAPTHLSYYQLTLEPNTLFAARPPTLPDENTLSEIQTHGLELLREANYLQYEVSAYAKDGFQSHHNRNYWLFGDYLGIGAGAHSKISFPAHNSIVRHSKLRHPKDYLANRSSAERIQQTTEVEPVDARLEFMMNALRLNEGFEIQVFQQRTGEPISVIREALDKAEAKGLLTRSMTQVKTTALGQLHLDTLLQEFMPVDNQTTSSKTVIPIVPATGDS